MNKLLKPLTSILLILFFFIGVLPSKAITTQYVTMNVGEQKTLSLPNEITSLTLKDVTFTSGDWSKLKIITNTATTVTVEAVAKSSGYIPITCEFYYYTLVDGKWIYAHHDPCYIMVAIIGGDNSGEETDPTPNSNPDTYNEWTREGNTGRYICTANTVEGIPMKFFTESKWTYFSSICETYSNDATPDWICIDKNTSGSITIPSIVNGRKVEGIGSYSFKDCKKLTDVIIPNSVELLGGFQNCTGLTSFYIPSKVNFIRANAFYGCVNMKSIILPGALTTMKNYVFGGCSSLTTVYCLNTVPPSVDYFTFDSKTYSDGVLFVPKGCKEAYQTASYWKQFKDIEEIVLPTNVIITASSQTVDLGSRITLSPIVSPSEAKDTIIWRTSNPNIAIVSPEGVVTGVGIGTAEITAITINGIEATCEVTCQQANHNINISKEGYATFYSSTSAYKLPNGLSAQVVTKASNGKLTFKTIADGSVSGVIPKGVAVMLTDDQKKQNTYMLTSTLNDVAYTGTNLLCGSDVATTTTGDGLHYKLSYGPTGTEWNDVFGWYWGAQDGAPFQTEGHKAWLVVSRDDATRGYTIAGKATGIILIGTDYSENETYYDMQGRRFITPSRKGVYLRKGKKIVIK